MKAPPWSFSSLNKYETCARQYYFVKVARTVKEPPTEHTIWGNKVHKALENRVKDKQVLPEDMQKWEKLAKKFDTANGVVFTEKKFAIDRNLQPCEWNEEETWSRGIVDIGVETREKAALFDWKTGKVKDDMDQLRLSSALYMQSRPYIQVVKTGYIWLAHNKITKATYERKDLPEIWRDFMQRSGRLEKSYETDKWLPTPSGLCNGWCPVGKLNCEFWSPKKGGR